ncbi:hypothetical protein QAD02_013530 [Eretmocerus hayati]|uniref:Uncharacterized protein n=1 Tax=Eretmocerus hayati TaxID=131215 RepID=A0ACC2P3Q2_9HYME|nr:hypothetical protein QAD02_013530 [Eretmocerus hayati]
MENSKIPAFVEYLECKRARHTFKLGDTRFFGVNREPTVDLIRRLQLSDLGRVYFKIVKHGCQYGTSTSHAVRSDNSYSKTHNGKYIRATRFILDAADGRSFVVCQVLNVEQSMMGDESPMVRVVGQLRENAVLDLNVISTISVAVKVGNTKYLVTPPNLLRC